MFETMQSFLLFFVPMVSLIIGGIIFEEQLITLEGKFIRSIRARFKQTEKADRKTVSRG